MLYNLLAALIILCAVLAMCVLSAKPRKAKVIAKRHIIAGTLSRIPFVHQIMLEEEREKCWYQCFFWHELALKTDKTYLCRCRFGFLWTAKMIKKETES